MGFRRDLRNLLREFIRFLLRLGAGRTVMGMLTVNANGVDGTVRAGAAGQLFNHLNRIFPLEVHRESALTARHRQPVFVAIHRNDPRRAHQQRAGNGELADRPAAEHHHNIATRDISQFGTKPGGRENVTD